MDVVEDKEYGVGGSKGQSSKTASWALWNERPSGWVRWA